MAKLLSDEDASRAISSIRHRASAARVAEAVARLGESGARTSAHLSGDECACLAEVIAERDRLRAMLRPNFNPGAEAAVYWLGDEVEKTGGDYTFHGEVVAVFAKRSGAIRYVVEDAQGLLHIFSDKNLTRTVES
jgi:hypothetical protein